MTTRRGSDGPPGQVNAIPASGQLPTELPPVGDPIAAALSESALHAFEKRIRALVEKQLANLLPKAIERACLSPWLDTKHAAAYLRISQNALRLRVREGLVLPTATAPAASASTATTSTDRSALNRPDGGGDERDLIRYPG